jgi:uroporphyrin-III C-methyltransferase / precorrin-2 dehydrogenase / sirohydrochlorin ferrochelatase
MNGHVSLVGAGPGDPGLLTRLAIARLRRADLVLYDALVDDRVLRYARKAQRFFVGKRAGRHALAQSAIEALMIKAARRGRRVVRLKGGDPFVFGRGGEEALALQRAGIPYDVVPGVTSAVAAPAAAGIPVTHRGLASGFVVVAGHDQAAFASAIESLAPNRLTIVVLMGLARSTSLAAQLIDRGWSRGTPAAVVVEAWTPEQQAWRGTLDELAADAVDIDRAGAGTIVVGEVVRLGTVSARPELISSPLILPSKDELALRQAQGERLQGFTTSEDSESTRGRHVSRR